MKGFVKDIEELAVKNDGFRRVLYTAKNCQLVVMSLKPKEEIGAEDKFDPEKALQRRTGPLLRCISKPAAYRGVHGGNLYCVLDHRKG
jgi:hypothetical protein